MDNARGQLILSVLDPNLKEEKSHSFSASVDLYRQLGVFQFNLMAEGFYTLLKDAFKSTQETIVHNGKDLIQKFRTNSDGAKVYGVNLEGKLAYLNVWQLQAGLTLQKNLWDTEQQWDMGDSYTTCRMYRTPHAYTYFIGSLRLTKRLDLSFSGNYTGDMLVGHIIPTEENGSLSRFNGKPAATIHPSRMQEGKGQTSTTYGSRTFKTPSFFEVSCKLSYDFPLYKYYAMQVYAGVQNLFNAYQEDFDKGPERDSAYIYGPGAPRSYSMGVKLNF